MQYLSTITAIIAFITTALSGIIIIPLLRRLKFGQTILDIGPKWHKNKQGTPTMGGFMFLFGTLLAICIAYFFASPFAFGTKSKQVFAGIVMAVLMCAIGFADDYIKVVKKQNLGLRARQKTFFQLLVAAGYLSFLGSNGMNTTYIPFIGDINIMSGIGLVFWPIALIFIYGFTNGVNLTDGVDGLAGSVTLIVAVFFMTAASLLNIEGVDFVAAALAGSCLGFLIWNLHPCKVMMGDTGSMFLGGMAVALAFMINMPVLLFLAGIIYLCEPLSVMIQVAYYKRTKKRIFKMSPIHHHFELSGWSENKIVIVFSLITFLGCALAMGFILINR